MNDSITTATNGETITINETFTTGRAVNARYGQQDTPTRHQSEAKARNNLVMDIATAYCFMSDTQRKSLVTSLQAKQAYFSEAQIEVVAGVKGLTPDALDKMIRFATALMNDDIQELKAIKVDTPDWPESLDSTITRIEQGKHLQPDLTMPAGISLDEQLELLLKHSEVLRAGEVNAALGMIKLCGVKS